MPRQLTLDLPVRAALGREDFFLSPANELALATLDAGHWPQSKLILTGPEGAGKSHLAAVWAGEQGAAVIAAKDLSDGIIPASAGARAVVIEDADRIAGDMPREVALFHLHNLLQAAGAALLLTARRPPRDWGLQLADLRSRMEATGVVTLDPPDDSLLAAVLVKLFTDRQIQVQANLVDYLLARMDRSFAEARRLVDRLDQRALALGRPVTRTLAAEVLDISAARGP